MAKTFENIYDHDVFVEVWPSGYADKKGLTKVRVAAGESVRAAVRGVGTFAEIYNVRPANPEPRPVEVISPEYAREMSFRDNS